MTEGFVKTIHQLEKINAFIVWHEGEANIFQDETSAMDFINGEREKRVDISFEGWSQSESGRNMITELSPHDPVKQHDRAAALLTKRPLNKTNRKG